MNIKYQNTVNGARNYMILETGFDITAGNEREILRSAHVESLLPFYSVDLSETKDRYQIWYDTSKMLSVKDYLSKYPFIADEFLGKVRSAMTEFMEGGVDPTNLLIMPETVYVDENRAIHFAYYPQTYTEAKVRRNVFSKYVHSLEDGVEIYWLRDESVGMIDGDQLIRQIRSAMADRKSADAIPLQAYDIIHMIESMSLTRL